MPSAPQDETPHPARPGGASSVSSGESVTVSQPARHRRDEEGAHLLDERGPGSDGEGRAGRATSGPPPRRRRRPRPPRR